MLEALIFARVKGGAGRTVGVEATAAAGRFVLVALVGSIVTTALAPFRAPRSVSRSTTP